jgi:hypothetical protein
MEECLGECTKEGPECVGIEYSENGSPNGGYRKNDCNLSSGDYIADCPNEGYDLTFVKKSDMCTNANADGTSGDRYQGRLNNYKQYGKGYYNWAGSGNDYYGMWLNGAKHGMGIMNFDNGSTYQGEWIENMMHGSGLYNFTSGKVYNG